MATRTPTAPVNDWVDVGANDWQDVPAGGAPAQPQKPAGNFLERALRPVDEALTEGSRMMYEGGKAAWNEPTWERKAKGVSQVIRGAGTAMSPALAPAVLANPIATAGRLGAGLIAQKAVEGTGKAVGVPEGYSELAGDVAGGLAASKGPTSLAGVKTAARTVRGAAQGAAEAAAKVPLVGTIPAGAIRGAIKGFKNEGPPPPPRPTAAPPAQTGSNNRTPLPVPPVTAPPPAQRGSNAPPLPPPRQQVAPPQQIGSNAPPLPPAREMVAPPAQTGSNAPPLQPTRRVAPPAQQGSNNRTPVQTSTTEAGPPIPPAPTPQVGPPTPPAAGPQSGPPQPPKPLGVPENEAFTGAGENTGKGTKESVIKGHRTVRGKHFGRYFRDEKGIPTDWPWKLGDPRFEAVAKAAGTTPPNTPEALQILMDEVKNTPPKGSVEYATGGVIVPAGKEKVRGMAHRWGPKGRR